MLTLGGCKRNILQGGAGSLAYLTPGTVVCESFSSLSEYYSSKGGALKAGNPANVQYLLDSKKCIKTSKYVPVTVTKENYNRSNYNVVSQVRVTAGSKSVLVVVARSLLDFNYDPARAVTNTRKSRKTKTTVEPAPWETKDVDKLEEKYGYDDSDSTYDFDSNNAGLSQEEFEKKMRKLNSLLKKQRTTN